jgi:hypothetical protein
LRNTISLSLPESCTNFPTSSEAMMCPCNQGSGWHRDLGEIAPIVGCEGDTRTCLCDLRIGPAEAVGKFLAEFWTVVVLKEVKKLCDLLSPGASPWPGDRSSSVPNRKINNHDDQERNCKSPQQAESYFFGLRHVLSILLRLSLRFSWKFVRPRQRTDLALLRSEGRV